MLQGKNAVVTGCMRGIGYATMARFAENGANIWACAQANDPVFEEQIAELSQKCGVWIKPIYFDLTDEAAIKAGMKQIVGEKMPVDVLVNIAGMTYNALFQMTPMSAFEQVMQVDFFSHMLISQYIAKLMIRQRSGCIVNVSSIAGIDGNAGQVAYSAAKGALISATKTMAAEFGAYGIRVNAVAPGVIDTAMTQSLTDEIRAKLIEPANIPRLGDSNEVANAILFLASDRASLVTKQVLRVDGGIG